MRQWWISLAIVVGAGVAGCSSCDVCTNVGGPCGYYSLAGRPLPPPVVSSEAESEQAQPEPYQVEPEMPTGPTAPDIK